MPTLTQAPDAIIQHTVTDDLEELLKVLPPGLRDEIIRNDHMDELLEIVMDLGREPEARYPRTYARLGERAISGEDIAYVVDRVGEFGKDNRAGIERTLHRISAIRNRSGRIVGLTCRIGRAIYGTIDIIRDVVEGGQSILMLGRPGIGKTTKLREVARVLSTEFHKRVIVVDTSNEIAGDGDIPHPAIGEARRMQVSSPELQHAVMIEAVENHMPEVIVIDEIGTEAEANAARTIAERGVQLVGTAHGNSLENLMMNPTLCDLIGGIQAVTLGDEEARRRGTQKTVLERKALPTFDCVIELMEVDRLAIHRDVASVVDRILRGETARPEIRVRAPDGEITVVQQASVASRANRQAGSSPLRRIAQPEGRSQGIYGRDSEMHVGMEGDYPEDRDFARERPRTGDHRYAPDRAAYERPATDVVAAGLSEEAPDQPRLKPVKGHAIANIFPYGVSRSRLERAIQEMSVPGRVTRDVRDAHLVLTLKSHYRPDADVVRGAGGLPVFVIKSNTYVQIANALRDMFQLGAQDPEEAAMKEAEDAIQFVTQEEAAVELSPQSSYIRRLQHQLVDRYSLLSESVGHEPNRRVRVYRP